MTVYTMDTVYHRNGGMEVFGEETQIEASDTKDALKRFIPNIPSYWWYE